MNITSFEKLETYRKLCVKKDLIELSHWIDTVEHINVELDSLVIIEKNLIKSQSMVHHLQGLRRKNTLVMGTLCQNEGELRKELEFGKREYDLMRAKEHERKRDLVMELVAEFGNIKSTIYSQLTKFRRT